MSEDLIVSQAAPTLAGIKTGNLFPCPFESREQLNSEIREFNRTLGKKGLRLLPLRQRDRKMLLYLYRPARLKEDLSAEEAKRLLREAGYSDLSERRCLCELMRRLRHSSEFPHEIGLFLSYPPEDVRGFIEHRGKDSKLDGFWKVYGDVQKAEAVFRSYRSCTAQLRARHWRKRQAKHHKKEDVPGRRVLLLGRSEPENRQRWAAPDGSAPIDCPGCPGRRYAPGRRSCWQPRNRR